MRAESLKSAATRLVWFTLTIAVCACGSVAPTQCPSRLSQIVLVDHQQICQGPMRVEVCPSNQEYCTITAMESPSAKHLSIARFCLSAAEFPYDVRLYQFDSDEVVYSGSFIFPSSDESDTTPSEAVIVWQRRTECVGIVVVNMDQSPELTISAACTTDEYDAAVMNSDGT